MASDNERIIDLLSELIRVCENPSGDSPLSHNLPQDLLSSILAKLENDKILNDGLNNQLNELRIDLMAKTSQCEELQLNTSPSSRCNVQKVSESIENSNICSRRLDKAEFKKNDRCGTNRHKEAEYFSKNTSSSNEMHIDAGPLIVDPVIVQRISILIESVTVLQKRLDSLSLAYDIQLQVNNSLTSTLLKEEEEEHNHHHQQVEEEEEKKQSNDDAPTELIASITTIEPVNDSSIDEEEDEEEEEEEASESMAKDWNDHVEAVEVKKEVVDDNKSKSLLMAWNRPKTAPMSKPNNNKPNKQDDDDDFNQKLPNSPPKVEEEEAFTPSIWFKLFGIGRGKNEPKTRYSVSFAESKTRKPRASSGLELQANTESSKEI